MKTRLIGIINGVDVQVDIDKEKTILDFIEVVCTNSNNTGRPFKQWIVQNQFGKALSHELKVDIFQDAERLFFNLDFDIKEKRIMKAYPIKEKIVLCAKEIIKELGQIPTFGGGEVDKRLGTLYLLVSQLKIVEED